MLEIYPIPAFSDNYIWCLVNSEDRSAFVVDPGDAEPVEAYLNDQSLTLKGVLITHFHPDHTGGLARLKEKHNLVVYGPHSAQAQQTPNRVAEGCELITNKVSEGENITVLGHSFTIYETPGHTLDHIVYFSESLSALFSGDTLFYGGCGRIFEGNPKMMQHSLDKLRSLPSPTRVYCAHEYTQSNLHFAQHVEPDNKDLQEHISHVKQLREKGLPTVPSTIETECLINPFLRSEVSEVMDSAIKQGCPDSPSRVDVFASIRAWKDNF